MTYNNPYDFYNPIKQKQKDPEKKLNFFVLIESLLCIGIIFFTCTERPSLTSLAFTGSFIVLLIQTIVYLFLQKKFNAIDGIMFVIILLSLVNVIASTLIDGIYITFNYMKEYLIFLATILFFRLVENIRISRKMCTIIFFVQMLICAIYIYTYYFRPQEYVEYSFNGLSLNFSNPNLTAMFLLQSALYMVLGVFYFEKIILKAFCLIFCIVMLKYILETECRNALISFALFLGIFFLCFFKIDFKFSKLFIFLVNSAPIIFVPVYLIYIELIVEKGWFSFLAAEGKNLDSRVKIWKRAFEVLGDFTFIGNYADAAGNVHNSHMVLLCSYGIIILILVILFNCLIVHRISSKVTTKFQVFALAAFFSVIFMGFGEGALYSGGVGIYILCGTFLILANSNFDNDKSIKKGSFFIDKRRL